MPYVEPFRPCASSSSPGPFFFWVLDSWGSGCLQEIGSEPILSHGVKPTAHGGASFEKMPIVFHDESLQRDSPAQKVALGVALGVFAGVRGKISRLKLRICREKVLLEHQVRRFKRFLSGEWVRVQVGPPTFSRFIFSHSPVTADTFSRRSPLR